jgi:hypothetical protein
MKKANFLTDIYCPFCKAKQQKPIKSWSYSGAEVSRFKCKCGKFIEMMLASLSNEITCLQILKEEIAPRCKHPKKMHDICEGQQYCMACNTDL